MFRCSNPTPEPVDAPQGYGPITWPQLTENELNYMWIHLDDVEPRINFRQKEMAFWREYMSYIVDVEIMAADGMSLRACIVNSHFCIAIMLIALLYCLDLFDLDSEAKQSRKRMGSSETSRDRMDSSQFLKAMEKTQFGAFNFN